MQNIGLQQEPGAPNADGFIIDPRDSDVLCGRGGAALRHPGNQTYRRLVNLNKGLYITCLKTEKLKISRSIVAAIREQNGRFLEKDSDKNAWVDIGDKKAVEKTSQALREGQPKLRQRIAEMGAVAAVHQASQIEYANGMNGAVSEHDSYSQVHQDMMPASQVHTMQNQQMQHQLQQQQQIMRQQELLQRAHSGGYDQQQQQQQQQQAQLRHQSTQAADSRSMQPLPSMAISSTVSRQQELHADMLNRLSLQDLQTVAAATGDLNIRTLGGQQQQRPSNVSSAPSHVPIQQQQVNTQQAANRLRPSVNARASLARELGIPESQLSMMSEFSAYGGSIATSGKALDHGTQAVPGTMPTTHNPVMGAAALVNEGQGVMSVDSSFKRALMGLPLGSMHTIQNSDLMSFDANSLSTGGSLAQDRLRAAQQQSPAAVAAIAANNVNMGSDFDRRRVFAGMKYSRQPSERTKEDHSDFNMLESGMSLYSNFSIGMDSKPAASTSGSDVVNGPDNSHIPGSTFSGGPTKVSVETAKVIDHSSSSRQSIFGDVLSSGSRHSIMSGLSRTSDSSIDQSIFSDLSRKIGNVSTRSMAMSEISAFEIQEGDTEDDGEPEPIKFKVEGGPVSTFD